MLSVGDSERWFACSETVFVLSRLEIDKVAREKEMLKREDEIRIRRERSERIDNRVMYFKSKSIAELKSLLENSNCEQPFKSKNKTMLVQLAVNIRSIAIPGEEDDLSVIKGSDSDVCSELSCAAIGCIPLDPAYVDNVLAS